MQRFDRRQHPHCPHIPRSFKIFITISSGPNAKAEQAEMDDVIPWWRQNFIEEFSALASDVVVENLEDVNFVGGTEADRRLTKERVQVSKPLVHACPLIPPPPFHSVQSCCCSRVHS
jgi:hypothetical protein